MLQSSFSFSVQKYFENKSIILKAFVLSIFVKSFYTANVLNIYKYSKSVYFIFPNPKLENQ